MLASRLLAQHLPTTQRETFDLQGMFLKLATPRRRTDFQLIDFIRLLSLLTHNNVPPSVAIAWLAPRTASPLGSRLTQICQDMDLGADLIELLERWAEEKPDQLLIELVQKTKLALDRGTPLSQSLADLVESARAEFSASILARAGSSETKMLIPTVFLILPVTVLFAIYPSLSLLGSGI